MAVEAETAAPVVADAVVEEELAVLAAADLVDKVNRVAAVVLVAAAKVVAAEPVVLVAADLAVKVKLAKAATRKLTDQA